MPEHSQLLSTRDGGGEGYGGKNAARGRHVSAAMAGDASVPAIVPQRRGALRGDGVRSPSLACEQRTRKSAPSNMNPAGSRIGGTSRAHSQARAHAGGGGRARSRPQAASAPFPRGSWPTSLTQERAGPRPGHMLVLTEH